MSMLCAWAGIGTRIMEDTFHMILFSPPGQAAEWYLGIQIRQGGGYRWIQSKGVAHTIHHVGMYNVQST